MWKYIVKRLLLMIPILLGVTFIVFFIMNLTPGDPAAIILGDQASAEALAAMRLELGLDKPLLVRYFKYIWDMLHGDLGLSYKNQLSVWAQVIDKFPNTAILAVAGIFVALIIGIPVGIISAKKQYTALDNTSMVLSLIGVSMPNFWLGLLLSLLFALKLGWLPSQGMGSGFVGLLRSIVLPAITLGTGSAATVVRMTRSSMLEVIRQDYISTARAKGISERQVTFRHMLKNAMIPIVTAVGLQFGSLLGGAMLTETVFSWPGLGRLMVESINSKDIPMVMGATIFLAIMFSLVNLLVDLVYFKKNKLALVGMSFIILLLVIAISTIVIDLVTNKSFYNAHVIKQNLRMRLKGPSKDHIFGLDEFGRDIFLRMLWAVRYSLFMGVFAIMFSVIVGGVFGSVAGYYGKVTDNIIMRFMDILLAVPSMLLATAIVAALGTSLVNVLIAIAISYVPAFARTVRASVLTVKDQEYIEAAKAVGASDFRIIFKYILPNAMAPLIVQATLGVAGAILSIAGLSFLGLGIQPPTPEWGSMLSSARAYIREGWHITVIPGLGIMLTILALNIMGDGLRDALDPRLKN